MKQETRLKIEQLEAKQLKAQADLAAVQLAPQAQRRMWKNVPFFGRTKVGAHPSPSDGVHVHCEPGCPMFEEQNRFGWSRLLLNFSPHSFFGRREPRSTRSTSIERLPVQRQRQRTGANSELPRSRPQSVESVHAAI